MVVERLVLFYTALKVWILNFKRLMLTKTGKIFTSTDFFMIPPTPLKVHTRKGILFVDVQVQHVDVLLIYRR